MTDRDAAGRAAEIPRRAAQERPAPAPPQPAPHWLHDMLVYRAWMLPLVALAAALVGTWIATKPASRSDTPPGARPPARPESTAIRQGG